MVKELQVYLLLDIFSLLILGVILAKMLLTIDKRESRLILVNVLISSILYIICDIVWGLYDYNCLPGGLPVAFAFNCIYYLSPA